MFKSTTLRLAKKITYVRAANRNFHSGLTLCKGSVFNMPAMSPTMSEGGVVSWKYKSGDEFAAGDVLLEVETDKATIDVEAQDDGVMWEILVDEGTSGVPVGKPIAFLAEPGDDLSTLEKPNIEEPQATVKETASADKQVEDKKPEKSETAGGSKLKQDEPQSSSSGNPEVFNKANANQKLSPAVELLLHQNHISEEDAYSKIPASGPKGRLLKGDILAYLGTIEKDSIIKITNFIKSREHLDLSNVVLAETKPTPAPEEKKEASAAEEKPKPKNILTFSVTSELGPESSKEAFISSFENNLKNSIKGTYSHRFPQYANSPNASSFHEIDLFDDIIQPPVYESRFSVHDIRYKFHNSPSESTSLDSAFDDLLGVSTSAPLKSSIRSQVPSSVSVDFKVKYNESLFDSKNFVEYFQDSLIANLPSKKLTITN